MGRENFIWIMSGIIAFTFFAGCNKNNETAIGSVSVINAKAMFRRYPFAQGWTDGLRNGRAFSGRSNIFFSDYYMNIAKDKGFWGLMGRGYGHPFITP